MHKIRLATLIEDEEYQKRFVHCLMNYYRDQFEIAIFSGIDQWVENQDRSYDVLILADLDADHEFIRTQSKRGHPVLYLVDTENEQDKELLGNQNLDSLKNEDGGICFVDKYQDVNEIVSEILKHIGEEIQEVQKTGVLPVKTRITAVYALTENEYQLPFAITLASILGEKEHVLLLDLQENSGFRQLTGNDAGMGLEELLVMAEADSFSNTRMRDCIGKLDKIDYVYPVSNTECLCEANASAYLKILQMLQQEMEYGAIILNLGSRFQGFFEVLNHCQDVYLMQRRGGLCQWREYEFMEELHRKGYEQLEGKLHRMELPILTNAVASCERLVEQWKWNEFGDLIRKTISEASGVMQVGG